MTPTDLQKFAPACIAGAIIGGLVVWAYMQAPATTDTSENATALNTVTYRCDDAKSIMAQYFEGEDRPEPKPGEMPVPTGSVEVSLDGGAPMHLNQTISASGIRYANADESFVFWSKGDEALIMRDNSMDLAYTNCTAEK